MINDLNPKELLIERLQEEYSIEKVRGKDIVSINSNAILYLRYNKNAGTTKSYLGKFWFGVTRSEYEKYFNKNLFIICACVFDKTNIDYLVFPSYEFDKIIKNLSLQSGQWKFTLLKDNSNRYVMQIPHIGKYDVTGFINYFDFAPRHFRKGYVPKIGKFEPTLKMTAEILETAKEIISLESELLLSSKDSSNPKYFEIALEKAFKELGFSATRIGGPGETDILVSEPIRFIVDGKSTKAGSKSSINFTRIKRHMKDNAAEFMVIASVGFDPAVARDAEIEGATLIDINTLINILMIHKENIFSPFDYINIFKTPGIINEDSLKPLYDTINQNNKMIGKINMLLKNLDFFYRSIDEIKGRLDLYCEQKNIELIKKEEIKYFISLLTNDIFRILHEDNGKYALRYNYTLARMKIEQTIQNFCRF
ncbi:MAG: hypothetical protein FJ126_08880 [Deltaproteobacteria bacterium]|nr:hypothetical protein [Deltaproteobacteria bacterium]